MINILTKIMVMINMLPEVTFLIVKICDNWHSYVNLILLGIHSCDNTIHDKIKFAYDKDGEKHLFNRCFKVCHETG